MAPPDPRAAYDRDGFYLCDARALPDAVVGAASAGMDEVRAGRYGTGQPPQPSRWNPGDPEDVLCKIEMPQIANEAIRALVSHPVLGAMAAAVTGARRVQVWWVQLLYKPSTAPKPGVNVGWHQDRQYWGAWDEGSQLFTAWVALSDVGPSSGPMRFVRGSHAWGLRAGEGNFFGQDLESQRDAIRVPAGASWEEVPAILPAGGVSLHDCLTFHGSSANTSGSPRRSLAVHMCGQSARPKGGLREGLTRFLDKLDYCPIVHPS